MVKSASFAILLAHIFYTKTAQFIYRSVSSGSSPPNGYFGGGLSPPGRILPVAIVIGMNESMCRENAVLSIEVDLAQLPTIKSASFAEECWMKSLGTSPRCYRSGLR